ncbi:LysR substrate-binding domain-containing protein [Bradyrhizobium cajani]|uniref:LysR substrate-binding domain-containing protein n=1 Tax=Bradyrhizobium cajani TaxID=1928661 RepID=UPI0028114552|nr:LysR substrate-binding domain-containing protein [Bradyrhizobium cajani]
MIGAPDAVLGSAIGPLLRSIATAAPHIDIGLIHLMPAPRGGAIGEPWQQNLDMLERRELDIAMLPLPAVSPRFEARRLYEEEFVLAMRKGHPLAKAPTHAAFARSQHLLVSLSGEPRGFVDEMLAKRGLERRVALTVPNFMMALAQLSGSDLIAALPRGLVEQHAGRFGLVFAELPFARKPDTIRAIATKAAMRDAGIAWLMQIVVGSIGAGRLEPPH